MTAQAITAEDVQKKLQSSLEAAEVVGGESRLCMQAAHLCSHGLERTTLLLPAGTCRLLLTPVGGELQGPGSLALLVSAGMQWWLQGPWSCSHISVHHCCSPLPCRCGASFEVAVISPAFEGKTLLQRHRLVNEALKQEMTHIHALSIKKAVTPAQAAAAAAAPAAQG